MSLPPHLRRQRILAGLTHGATYEPNYERACSSAASYLRGQGLRATRAEFDDVAGRTVRDVLFPPCDCSTVDEGAGNLFGQTQDRDTPGPHHSVHCPAWRGVRP